MHALPEQSWGIMRRDIRTSTLVAQAVGRWRPAMRSKLLSFFSSGS
jgi:hypothetical protein